MKKHREEESPANTGDSRNGDILLLKDRALDVAAEGITIADMRQPDQPLIYINEGFERLTGYSAESMLGKNCRFLQGNDADPETVQQIRDALKSGKECTVEILNQTKNGEKFWNRLSLTPVLDSNGDVTHFIGVQSDITKRINAEEAVREANRQLEIANRRMTRDLEAAARIQRSLLPDKLAPSDEVRFSWVVEPCDELAGDTLNVVPLDEKRFAVYMVDVSGHGVRASLLSVTLSHWFARQLEVSSLHAPTPDGNRVSFLSPAEVAEELNRQFQMSMENVQYFTMCYGVLDLELREFHYVTAGNPPLIVVRSGGEADVLTVEGFPIGLVEQPGYSENVIKLKPGDRVFVYTDGVIEAEDEHETPYGTERLADKLSKSSCPDLDECIESVLESVRLWEGHRGLKDDFSILAFELGEG